MHPTTISPNATVVSSLRSMPVLARWVSAGSAEPCPADPDPDVEAPPEFVPVDPVPVAVPAADPDPALDADPDPLALAVPVDAPLPLPLPVDPVDCGIDDETVPPVPCEGITRVMKR
jgi:hypothetical protein